jgi:hypothetical protein
MGWRESASGAHHTTRRLPADERFEMSLSSTNWAERKSGQCRDRCLQESPRLEGRFLGSPREKREWCAMCKHSMNGLLSAAEASIAL